MSIIDVRESLEGIPGAHECIMRYEDGGFVQAYSIGDVTVRVGPTASNEEIRAAFEAELAKSK